MRDDFIRVAAATPKIRVADPRYNREKIEELMNEACRQQVKVLVTNGDEKEIREYKASQLKFRPKRKKGRDKDRDKGKDRDREKDKVDAELKKLEAMEKKEGKSKLDDN